MFRCRPTTLTGLPSVAGKLFSKAPKTGQQPRLINTTAPVKGHYHYREMPKSARKWEIGATIAGAATWWWIFWHCFTDYHHLIGHYDFVDVNAWTDEELGIPADDADDPE